MAAYNTQLGSLTVTQQKMALSTTNLTAKQREQVLNYIAATAASKTMTAQQLLECSADQKQALIKAGLITAEEAQTGTTIKLTEAEIKKIIASEALTVEDKNLILSALGVTGANLTEASSWEVLAKSIGKATVKMLAWLFTTPAGWFTLTVSGIIAAIAAYNEWGATLENTREKLADLKSEYDTIASNIESVNSELETTKQRMDELEGRGNLTFTEKEEYDNLVKQNNELQRTIDLLKLEQKEKSKEKNKTFTDAMEKDVQEGVEKYDDHYRYINEQGYINVQFEKYQDNLAKMAELDAQYKDDLSNKQYKKDRKRLENQNKKISEYLRGKNTEFTTDSDGVEYIENPTTEDEEKVNKWLDFINDFQDRMAIAMGGDNAKTNAFNRVVDNWQFDDAVQELQDLGKEGKVTAEMIDDPKYDAFIQKLVYLGFIDSADNLDEVALAFNNVGTEAENSSIVLDETIVSLDNLKKASEGISSLQKAFKELTDDGYITIDTITSIKEAAGLSESAWSEYEQTLLSAKAGSNEFNQALSELTYKMLENEFSAEGLANATEEQIAAVLRENGVLEAEATAHDISTKAKAKAELATKSLMEVTEDEIKALGLSKTATSDLVTAYAKAQATMTQAMSEEALKRLNITKAEVEAVTSIAEAYNLISTSRKRDSANPGNLFERFKSRGETDSSIIKPLSEDERAIVAYARSMERIQEIIDSVTSVDYSSTSSSKNELLDNALKEAERHYKVHQNELEYIKELESVSAKYAKTKEEQLEIEDKIDEARKDDAHNQISDIEHQIELLKNVEGEKANVLEYYRRIQEIAHAEAKRLRELGYDDNSSEIQDLQNKWWEIEKAKEKIVSSQKDALDQILELTQDLIKWEQEQLIESLEEQKEDYQEIINKKKELIQLTKEESDHEKSVAEKLQEIAKLQSRIDQLSLDDSREAQAQKKGLEEELNELQKELADDQADYVIDVQIDALDKELEAFEDAKDDEIRAQKKMLDSTEELYQAAISRIDNDWDSLYQDLLSWNAEYGSTLQADLVNAWDAASAAVQRYGSFVEAYANSSPFVKHTVDQMKENSELWKQTSDKSKRKELEDQNSELGKILENYLGKDVYRDEDSGVWWIDGKKLFDVYHTGGVVGNNPSLKQNEVISVLEEGEMVLTKEHQSQLIPLMTLAEILGMRKDTSVDMTTFTSPFIHPMSGTGLSRIPLPNNISNHEAINFNPEITVNINHSGGISDSDLKYYGDTVADVALDKLKESFSRRGIGTIGSAMLK